MGEDDREIDGWWRMKDPALSVVMTIYDGERYLYEAIQSILDQSYQDFEIIIVSEHGTSTASLETISRFSDPRIVHLHNYERIGLVRSLNRGLSAARGKYIARMDGDDVCEKDRFERQKAFLEKHHEVGGVGTAITFIDGKGRAIITSRYPDRPKVVRWEMFFRSAIANPSVMFRSDILKKVGVYNEAVTLAEDYDLWLRVLTVSELANIPDALLRYRIHGSNISSVREAETSSIADRLALGAITKLTGEDCSMEAVSCLRDRSRIMTALQGQGASDLLAKMHQRYIEKVDPSLMDQVRIHAVTLRLQLATSLRFLKFDPLGSFRTIGRNMTISPSTAILGLVPAVVQLLAYALKMRELGQLDRNV